VGSDSHTCSYGALGVYATDVDRTKAPSASTGGGSLPPGRVVSQPGNSSSGLHTSGAIACNTCVYSMVVSTLL
jgi:hypothetical protein